MTDVFASYLERLSAEGNRRHIKSAAEARELGQLTDLASNDYLGLAHRHELVAEFLATATAEELQLTSSASRLLSLRQHSHQALEETLAALYGREVLLFNSGYHANVGTVSALAAMPRTLIVADRLVHASIIDGMVLSRADFRRFRHNDIESLRAVIRQNDDRYSRFVVIVESIYSMDGDVAPLAELAQLRRENPNVLLYVDEAHAFGVRGERGLGVCEELGIIDDVDVVIGTLGKAAASSGAFVATTPTLKEYLINAARSLIFSTALPPINCAWSRFIIERITAMSAERKRLARLSALLYEYCNPLNGGIESRSQIVPLVVGDARRVVAVSGALRQEGFVALPIRKPTVAAGTERIRFSLNASLPEEEVRRLISVLSHTEWS